MIDARGLSENEGCSLGPQRGRFCCSSELWLKAQLLGSDWRVFSEEEELGAAEELLHSEEGLVGDSSTGGMGDDLTTATFLLVASETILPQIVFARVTAAAAGPALFSDNIARTCGARARSSSTGSDNDFVGTMAEFVGCVDDGSTGLATTIRMLC